MPMPKTVGIILDRRNQRAVLTALHVGRQAGLRSANDAVDALMDQLAQARGLVARLEAEIEQHRCRHEATQEMLRRTNRVVAMCERRDGVTVH
jgi:hypothetical protein